MEPDLRKLKFAIKRLLRMNKWLGPKLSQVVIQFFQLSMFPSRLLS